MSHMFHSELSSSPSRHRAKVCRPSRAGGAQLVQHGHAIEKPDHVALVVVLVDVLEVRIEGVVIEIQVGVGVGGALPGVGDVQDIGVEDLRRLVMPAVLRRLGMESVQS